MQDRLPQLPEVAALTLAMSPPFADLVVTPNFRVSVTAPGSDTREQHIILRRRVGTGYFSTLGIPVVQGREIEARDQRHADAVGGDGEIRWC